MKPVVFSIQVSKSPIFTQHLNQRMWSLLLNAGCKFQFYHKTTFYIQQGQRCVCYNSNYAKLLRGIPISHIFVIYNITACNQMWIPAANFNFSIEENPKRVTITEKHLIQSMNLDFHKIMRVMLFYFPNWKGSRIGRTLLRIFVTK